MSNPITEWFFRGQNTRIPNEAAASLGELFRDDWDQRGKFGKDGSQGGWDFTRGFRPGVSADEGGFMSGPTPLARQAVLRSLNFVLGQNNPLTDHPDLPPGEDDNRFH